MAEASASNEEVELKFVIVPEGFSHTRRLPLSYTLLEMKQAVEADLRIPTASMKLVFQGAEMASPSLRDYGLSTTEPNQIELQIVYMEERPTPSSYTMRESLFIIIFSPNPPCAPSLAPLSPLLTGRTRWSSQPTSSPSRSPSGRTFHQSLSKCRSYAPWVRRRPS